MARFPGQICEKIPLEKSGNRKNPGGKLLLWENMGINPGFPGIPGRNNGQLYFCPGNGPPRHENGRGSMFIFPRRKTAIRALKRPKTRYHGKRHKENPGQDRGRGIRKAPESSGAGCYLDKKRFNRCFSFSSSFISSIKRYISRATIRQRL